MEIKKITLALLSVFILPISADAASLYFSPNSGSYEIGNIISVGIYVSSPNESINAASGVINFSNEKMEVVSLSKVKSIFDLWVKEPSFSNTSGVVNFEGVVLSQGFVGGSGKILTINFKIKKEGTGDISFSSSSVLANDGKGTDVISNTEMAHFYLTNKLSESSNATFVSEVATSSTPLVPNVSSTTHPDQEKWYNTNSIKLSWEVPSDVDKIRTLLNKNPNSIPSVLYSSSIKEKELNDLDDGTWYFHTQFRNSLGWGAINHFKIQIDTKNPEPFEISIIKGINGETSRPIINFETTDSLSGIDYYKIRIEQEPPFIVSKEQIINGEYTLPDQYPGNKMIMVRAFDRAGNYFAAAEEITIKSLENPSITEYPTKLTSEEFLNIKGTSKYPNSQVNIYFEKNGETIGIKKIATDSLGNFYLAYEGTLKSGNYNIKAEIIDDNGLRSINNQAISLIVKDPEFIRIKAELLKIGVPFFL